MTEHHMVAPLVVGLNPNWVFSMKIWLRVCVPSGFSPKNSDAESLGPALVLDLGLCIKTKIKILLGKLKCYEKKYIGSEIQYEYLSKILIREINFSVLCRLWTSTSPQSPWYPTHTTNSEPIQPALPLSSHRPMAWTSGS